MSDDQLKTSRHRRWWIFLLIAAVGLVGLFVLYRMRQTDRIEAKLDEIRRAGYPVTLEELNEWYPAPPPGEANAADVLLAAFSKYKTWDDEKSKGLPLVDRKTDIPARNEPLSEETKKLIAEYLADNAEAITLLHEAAGVKHCRFPIDLTQGWLNMTSSHMSPLRKGARMLYLEALLNADNDDFEAGSDAVVAAFGLARSLKEEPVLISHLVRVAVQSVAISSLERVLNRTSPTDHKLVSLFDTVREAEDLKGVTRALAGERCMFSACFTDPAVFPGMGANRPANIAMISYIYSAAGLKDLDHLTYLELMTDHVKGVESPFPQRCRTGKDLDARIEALPRYCFLARILMPAVGKVVETDARTIAYLRTAQTALAIERYRLSHGGELPGALADLVPTYLPATRIDPFDGDSLRYKKLAKGYIVYSIGPNCTDDGGTEAETSKGKRQSSLDITFIVER
jgi:hypothetical protein